MLIGEVSRKYGVSIHTLRYYEKMGLIGEIQRDKSGHRDYNDETLERLQFVIHMRNAGLSIELLKKYFELGAVGEETVEERREILLKQKDTLALKIAGLQASLSKLNAKIELYDQQLLYDQKKEN